MILHTFGDSHALHPWERIKLDNLNIKIHILSRGNNFPMTCSTFGFQKLKYLNIKDYEVNDNDIICFCFGETDCRFKLHKYKENYQELINKIVENYFKAIKLNVEQFHNILTIIVSVPPVVQFALEKNKSSFPVLGEDSDRKKYSEYFNSQLKIKCLEYEYINLDSYNLYLNDAGYLNSLYSDNLCHIMDAIYAIRIN